MNTITEFEMTVSKEMLPHVESYCARQLDIAILYIQGTITEAGEIMVSHMEKL